MKSILSMSWAIQYLKDPLRKNSIFLIAAGALTPIFGFLFWMVVARLYPPQQVGLAAALLSAAFLLVMLSRLGLDVSLIRFLPQQKDKQGMINSCFTITGLLSIALAVVFILGLKLWSPALLFLQENMVYWLIFVLLIPILSLSPLQNTLFVAFRDAKWVFIRAIIGGLKIPLVVLLASLVGAMGIFSAAGLADGIAFFIGILFIIKLLPAYRPIPTIRKEMVNDMLHFSLGNYVADNFFHLPGLILPLLVVNVLNPEMGAYFYIAWAIASILIIFPGAISASLLAEGSYAPEKLRGDAIRATKFVFLLLIPAVLVLLFLGDTILSLLGVGYSQNALTVLWLLVLSSVPVAVNALYATIKRVQKEVKPIIYVYSFIALFVIAGSYVLMKEMGLVGIGIAWISGNGIAALVTGLLLLRQAGILVKVPSKLG